MPGRVARLPTMGGGREVGNGERDVPRAARRSGRPVPDGQHLGMRHRCTHRPHHTVVSMRLVVPRPAHIGRRGASCGGSASKSAVLA